LGRNTFGNVQKEIKELTAKLDELRGNMIRSGPTLAEIKIVDWLVELRFREETMWRQRSPIQCLAEGDKNMHFFHLRASQRKKKNLIKCLKQPDGVITKDEAELERLTSYFYRDLLTS
jgi:hypothetical protein